MSKKKHAKEIQRSSSWWVSMARYYALGMSAIAVILMSGIVIIMNVEIIYRYVLNDSLIWAEAVCCYLMVWMTFLLLGPAFQRGEFIAVEFIVKNLPPFLRLVSVCLAYGTSITFLAAVSDYGYHFGVIVVLNLVIGLATPPVGLCLFILCSIAHIPLEDISRASFPLLIICIGVLILVTFVPAVSLTVPAMFAHAR